MSREELISWEAAFPGRTPNDVIDLIDENQKEIKKAKFDERQQVFRDFLKDNEWTEITFRDSQASK